MDQKRFLMGLKTRHNAVQAQRPVIFNDGCFEGLNEEEWRLLEANLIYAEIDSQPPEQFRCTTPEQFRSIRLLAEEWVPASQTPFG